MSTHDKVDALFKAAKQGDAEKIAKLRKKALQVTWYDDDDNTPLHHAAKGGHTAAVYELLKREGASAINVCNLADETPFTLAVQHGHTEIVRLMLSVGDVNINKQNALGRTALHLAVEHRAGADMIHLLLAAYADIHAKDFQKRTPLSLAREMGDTEIEELMRRENPALRLAAREGNVDKLRNLLAEGADLNARDLSGNGALAEALDFEEWDAVDMLIEAGARLTLGEMISQGNANDVKVLLKSGAKVNEQTLDFSTPLLSAIDEQDAEKIALLLSAGADVNLASMSGTPLTAAAWRDNTDIVQMLIDAGADVNAIDYQGKTALSEAILLGKSQHVSRLIRAGADVNLADSNGTTPLHQAIMQDYDTIVRALLAAGANPDGPRLYGLTPREWASDKPKIAAIIQQQVPLPPVQ